jgi:DNA-binding response OmpR family regulator
MVTTEAEQCRLAEAIEAGANDNLAKPFEAGTLRDKIKQYTCV